MTAVSIVIRTLNEKSRLIRLLASIKNQSFSGDLEIVVVDNESTDGTPEYAKQEGVTVISLARKEFTYPRSMNSGVIATNIALRRELWEQHHFDERFELGGEDTAWAKWALSQGYKIICDTKFVVRHSHNLGLWGVIQQNQYWNRLQKPSTFSRRSLKYRKDMDSKKESLKG